MIAEAKAAGVTPSVVVIAGGQNDSDEWLSNKQGDVRDAIAATYAKARQEFPTARIIAVGPSFLGGTARWHSDMDAAVRDAAASVEAEYVSLLDPPVLGDRALELGDGGHVNDLGPPSHRRPLFLRAELIQRTRTGTSAANRRRAR